MRIPTAPRIISDSLSGVHSYNLTTSKLGVISDRPSIALSSSHVSNREGQKRMSLPHLKKGM